MEYIILKYISFIAFGRLMCVSTSGQEERTSAILAAHQSGKGYNPKVQTIHHTIVKRSVYICRALNTL